MRIALVVHGFPPVERTGVETYAAALARSLVSRGHAVEVLAPRRSRATGELGIRREERDGYGVHWLTLNRGPRNPREMLVVPGMAGAFGAFLDREKPEVVHFQHAVKVGVDLFEEARKRGIPTLYTAHDYYPVCHRYTLLRPDLEHCDVRGDSAPCSRCDLALGFLNGIEGLGDYQMGALPDQLSPQEQSRLQAILAEDLEPSGLSRPEFDRSFDERFELDAFRARAFAAVDRVIAPTRFLADELARGGLDPERIQVLPYGVENADLADLPRVSREGGRPLRFAYLGALSKHKGVDVLVEAVRAFAPPGEVSIHGYATDRPYGELLRKAASGAGIRWAGAYDREDLPGILATVDVVVVPSIWVENYPIVIREAFSARRPVLAGRFGAMPESVRDGVDGLLFEPRDPASLASAMRRLAEEEGLLERLVAGIEPVKDIEEQAGELCELYASLLDERAERARAVGRDGDAAARPALPASLSAFVERCEALEALPDRELFRRGLEGLERLRTRLGDEVEDAGPVELLSRGLAESKALFAIRDLRQGREDMEKICSDLRVHLARSHSPEEIERLEAELSEVEVQLRNTAELGYLALRMQERVLRDEIEWRKGEMRTVYEATQRRFARLLLGRTGVGRHITGWQEFAADAQEGSGESSGGQAAASGDGEGGT